MYLGYVDLRVVCDYCSPELLDVMCDKIFGKKEDNFHFPIRARYAS